MFLSHIFIIFSDKAGKVNRDKELVEDSEH